MLDFQAKKGRAENNQEHTPEKDLVIQFQFDSPGLFETGFLTTDIFHLILISELSAAEKKEDIDRLYYGYAGKYRHPSRWDLLGYYDQFYNAFRLSKLNLGSIEIGVAIAAFSAVSSVIVPVSLFVLDKKLNKRKKSISINVYHENESIHKMLGQWESEGVDSIEETSQFIREYLRFKNIPLKLTGDNLFEIVDKTINRMEKTVEKVYEIHEKKWLDNLFK